MTNGQKTSPYCQLRTIPKMSSGLVDLGPMSLGKRFRFWLKRNLSARTKRRLKHISESFWNDINQKLNENQTEVIMKTQIANANPVKINSLDSSAGLKAGDLVHVRSRAEIESTLDSWNELKGCAVMPDMWQYCETIQRVFKVVERFVDERDYRLKKGTGIILLDGLVCQGTIDYGRCDRSCFYFWRIEWLENISE